MGLGFPQTHLHLLQSVHSCVALLVKEALLRKIVLIQPFQLDVEEVPFLHWVAVSDVRS